MSVVLDASALLAFLFKEPGGKQVEEVLEGAFISSINWSEVVQKLLQKETGTEGLRDDLAVLGLTIKPFDGRQAEQTASLWKKGSNLSLADRACINLATTHGRNILTADKIWSQVFPDLPIQLIR